MPTLAPVRGTDPLYGVWRFSGVAGLLTGSERLLASPYE